MHRIIQAAARVRFLRFAAVGLFNTVSDFVLLNVLITLTHTNTDSGIQETALNVISATSVALMSFFLNKKFVFDDEQGHESAATKRKFILFMGITLAGLFIVQGFIFWAVLHHIDAAAGFSSRILVKLGLNFANESFMQTNITKVLATGASMLWNYFMYKKFVFKELYIDDLVVE